MKATKRRTILAVTVILFTVLKVNAYFDPTVGRWASRDPSGENGGANLYGFVANDAIGKFDVLGRYPGIYTYSLVDMQAMLNQSKADFRRKLMALCPISQTVSWTTVHGRKECCTPDACNVQADLLTLEFAQYLQVSFTTEYWRFGNVIAFTPLWIPGETINDRANNAPNHGTVAADYNQGYGLKCDGMQDLIAERFVAIMAPLHRAGRQCFKAAKVGNNEDVHKATHQWVGIYGPFNNDLKDIDVDADPWFSAGGVISPDHRHSGEPQYFIPVLW